MLQRMFTMAAQKVNGQASERSKALLQWTRRTKAKLSNMSIYISVAFEMVWISIAMNTNLGPQLEGEQSWRLKLY